jgi:hypothetical protein
VGTQERQGKQATHMIRFLLLPPDVEGAGEGEKGVAGIGAPPLREGMALACVMVVTRPYMHMQQPGLPQIAGLWPV